MIDYVHLNPIQGRDNQCNDQEPARLPLEQSERRHAVEWWSGGVMDLPANRARPRSRSLIVADQNGHGGSRHTAG
jgi:hypothetical protein